MGWRSIVAILLAASALFGALSLPFFRWVPDDAYISYQYARNFADGDGLVFNPDERVEGFSNPLWTMALALVAKAGRDVEVFAPLLSYAAAALSLGVFLFLLLAACPAPGTGDRRSLLVVVGSFAAAYGAFFPLAFYASSGLETAPYTLCLLLGAALHLRAKMRGGEWRHCLSLLAFLLAALMRPEGVGFLLVNALFLLFGGPRSGKLRAAAALSIFAYLTALSIRFEYYGSLVPNTYFAKPPATLHYLSPVLRGLRYLSRFLTHSGFVLPLVLALAVPQDPKRRYAWLYMWALAAYQVFFIVVSGADVLRFDRFAVPLAPWVYALAAVGLLAFADGSDARRRSFSRRLALSCFVVLAALNAAQAVRAERRFCFHDWMHSRAHRALGTMLGELIPPGAEIVANEIGAIRYYSHRPVVDMLGLTDKTVASVRYRSFQEHGVGSSPESVKEVTTYLFGRDPECIVIPSQEVLSLSQTERHKATMHPLWYALLAAPRLEDRYRPVLHVEIHESKHFYVFLRNDIDFPPDHFAVPHGECMEVRRLDS